MTDISKEIQELADFYNVNVFRDIWNDCDNCGYYNGEIGLGKFDDPDLERMAFFHELGHHLLEKTSTRKYFLSTISKEGAAWEIGLTEAGRHGYFYDYYSKESKWAREQLHSYIGGEYDDIARKNNIDRIVRMMSHSRNMWIGVDLDSTLAIHVDGQNNAIGEPIPEMLERVKKWISEGITVKILTARAAASSYNGNTDLRDYYVNEVKRWCRKHLEKELEVTAEKDFYMLEFWDDRCIQVIPNTGIRADGK